MIANRNPHPRSLFQLDEGIRIFLIFLLFLIFLNFPCSSLIFPANLKESYRIKLVNKPQGLISVSSDKGKTWQQIGKVVYPTQKIKEEAFTASKWMENGKVAATSVNALHIKTDYNEKEDRGIIFSIVPTEFKMPKENYPNNVSPNASIYTNLAAGETIFGGGYAPFAGNAVLANGKALSKTFVPKIGDSIEIVVERPDPYPRAIVFENKFGGKITLTYLNGSAEVIGEVMQPVIGVGRFDGSFFANAGRVRANHPGVICISTSPLREIGGFQIIPSEHGMSEEMKGARQLTQWMVIGGPSVADSLLQGKAPFFKNYIQPSFGKDDLDQDDWQERLLKRFLVEVKLKGNEKWKAMPIYSIKGELPSWAGAAMEKVSHIRILFPLDYFN